MTVLGTRQGTTEVFNRGPSSASSGLSDFSSLLRRGRKRTLVPTGCTISKVVCPWVWQRGDQASRRLKLSSNKHTQNRCARHKGRPCDKVCIQFMYSNIQTGYQQRTRCFSLRMPCKIRYKLPLVMQMQSPFKTFPSSLRHSYQQVPSSKTTTPTQSTTYGTMTTPKLPACPTTLLHKPSKLKPFSLPSDCLIFAIS